jgi:hypothetical protein
MAQTPERWNEPGFRARRRALHQEYKQAAKAVEGVRKGWLRYDAIE